MTETNNFLSGISHTKNILDSTDWSLTRIGVPSQWPDSLRTIVSAVTDSPLGMSVLWGGRIYSNL